MGIKIGICEWALPGRGRYGCRIASQVGLEGIEVELGDYERDFPLSYKSMQEAYLEASEQWGIQYPSIAVNSLCSYGMTNPKGSEKGEIALKAITKGIETAEALKIPLVQLPSFEDGEIKTEEDFQITVEYLKYACDYAGQRGILVGTENVLTVEESLRMLDAVGMLNLKVYFDTQNYHLNKGYNTAEIFAGLVPYICEIHIKDGNGFLSGACLGEGDAGFYDVITLIKKHNYLGWLHLENYYDQQPLSLIGNPYNLLEKDVKIIKECLST